VPGGFDPALGAGTPTHGAEDLDIFFRIVTEGGTIVYEPGAVVRHRHRRHYAELTTHLHGYGVGLAAVLTKRLVERPTRALELAMKAPAGLRLLLSSDSPKNRQRRAGYPRELARQELTGMLRGPAAYLLSSRAAKRRQAGRG
jgi:hypothetical protein